MNETSKGLDGPSEKDDPADDADDEVLNKEEAKEFRRISATANYLASDRPDIQYSVKEVCRRMAKPAEGDWQKLARLGRYLRGASRLSLIQSDAADEEDSVDLGGRRIIKKKKKKKKQQKQNKQNNKKKKNNKKKQSQ